MSGRHGNNKYPWDEWFQSPELVLVRGRDYRGRTDTMIQQVRGAASKRGKRIRVEVEEDQQSFRVIVLRTEV